MNHRPIREEYDVFPTPPPKVIEAQRTIIGYVLLWNAVSGVRRDGYRHQYNKGSVFPAPIIYALWAGDPGRPIACTRNDTLRLKIDARGVKVEMDIDDTTYGENAFKCVQSKLAGGLSFSGKRLTYQKTDEPGVIEVKNFVLDRVIVQVNKDEIGGIPMAQADWKRADSRLQSMTLDRIKLSSLVPRK